MLKSQRSVVAVLLGVIASAGSGQESVGRTVPSIERDMGTFRNTSGDWLFLGVSSSGRPYYMLGDRETLLTEQEADFLLAEDGTALGISRHDDKTFKAIDLRTPDGAIQIYEYSKTYEVLETTVESGPVKLQCTYVEPITPGPHPAVVFAHGSGPNLRSRYMDAIWKYAVAGVASFACDKRGSGESGGSLLMAGFEDLSDDLIRSVRHVASSYDIDPTRLGVVGISQAGWVMPLAASKEPLIRFVISISGCGMPLAVQEHYLIENNLKYGGFGKTAVRLAHQMIRVANSGIRTLQSERAQAMGLVMPRIDKYFDPGTVWPGVEQPTLAIFGSHDRHVPPGSSARILSEALAARAPQGSRVLVLRGADHGMRMSESGFAAEPVPSERIYPPGYLSAMTRWITSDFQLGVEIPGQLDEAEIVAAADAEAIRSPYASIANHFVTKVLLLLSVLTAAVVSLCVEPLWHRLRNRRKGELPARPQRVAWRWFRWVSALNVFMAVVTILTALILLSFSGTRAGALNPVAVMVSIFSLVASALSVYTIYRFAVRAQREEALRTHGSLARIVLVGLIAFPLFTLSWYIG